MTCSTSPRSRPASSRSRLPTIRCKDVVARRATAQSSRSLQEKQIALKVELATDLPRAAATSASITQVLLNLVGNAIKFTDEGEVAIKAAAANGSYHDLSVRDTGSGIAEADQAKIFQEFQQADNCDHAQEGRHRAGAGDLQAHCRDCMGDASGSSRARGRAQPSHSRFRSLSNSRRGQHEQSGFWWSRIRRTTCRSCAIF